MSNPQGIFVRECPSCKKLKHTNDQTGKTQCAKCETKRPTPQPVIVPPPPDEDDDDFAVSLPQAAPAADPAPQPENSLVESFSMPGFTVSGGPTVDAAVTEDEPRGRHKKKN